MEEKELTPELFFKLFDEARENLKVEAQLDHFCFDIGIHEGNDFIIIDSYEAIRALTAAINGYTGNLSMADLYYKDDLNVELDKATIELEKALVEHPDHLGTHSRLEKKIQQLSNLSAYKRWLLENEIEEKSIDDYGIESGFSDEYSLCCHCGQEVVRTSPNCYDWQPPLFLDCEGWVCDECSSNYNDHIMEEFCNKAKGIPSQFEPTDLGLVKVNDESYQNGLHYGMDDSPEPIIKRFVEAGIDVWFTVEPSQFNVDFDVWVREADKEKATEVLANTNTYQGFSSAGNCEKALKGIKHVQGEGISYTTVDVSTGTSKTRLVSKEEFINGIKE